MADLAEELTGERPDFNNWIMKLLK
jgi:hypothetical protein